MADFQITEQPIYRHIIVKRRGFIDKVANPEDFRRLRAQLEAGQSVDPDLEHLVVKDSTRNTLRKVMNWSGHSNTLEESDDGVDASQVLAEANTRRLANPDARDPVQYRGQGAVVVATLNKKHVPGGDEPLPLTPKVLSHPGFEQADDPAAEFLRAAQVLQAQFRSYSDRKFLLLDKWQRESVTLVTVAYTPIMAAPRADRGLELFCEFHQTTRFGQVDTTGFEVYSDTGEYPITQPNAVELMTMMRSADEVLTALPPRR